MSTPSRPARSRWDLTVSVPPPDSMGGAAIAIGVLFALVYGLLLIAQYPAMLSVSVWLVSLALVVGAVGSFGLATMIGSDIANYQRLELDLARTILGHLSTSSAPGPDAPLAGTWRAYVAVADESRRVARVHAYAFGPFLWGTLFSLVAALLIGLGTVTAASDVMGLALWAELIGFSLLLVGGAALLLTVGYSEAVPGFDRFAAHRWRRNSTRLPAVEEAIESVPWLPEFHRGVRESRTEPAASTLHWVAP